MNAELGDQVQTFLNDVSAMKELIADVEVPGWVIGKPTLSRISEDLVIVVATSKEGETYPFVLPEHAEASIAVLEGSIQLNASGNSVIVGRHFAVLAPGVNRTIVPLEPHTRIYATFFRSRVSGDGHSVDSR